MLKWKQLLGILVITLVSGCSILPKEPLVWSVSVVVPEHYDAWVDYLELETSGIRRWRVPVGFSTCCWRAPAGKGEGGYRHPPPNFVVIRWFSFAERKFYSRQIALPADLEERMRRKTLTYGNDVRLEPQDSLIIGLAPGGQIVIWIMNQAQNAEEILRIQAFEEEVDVAQYEGWIREYDAEHGDYIRQHGLQYDSW